MKKLKQVIQEESKRGRKETEVLRKAVAQRLGALGSAVEARAGTKAAAGRTKGEIHFDGSDPYGGLASTTPFENNNLVAPVTTLDHEMEAKGLQGPFLTKSDTHGFEMPILEGAVEVLKQTRVIVMECYNFKISPDCLTFPEMCVLLAGQGFWCADMADVLHREKDGALWQMDIAFVRDDAAVFADNSYR